MAEFLRGLFETGEPGVVPFDSGDRAVSTTVPTDAGQVLREWEARVREEMAGEAPPFSLEAAAWAAQAIHRACQLLVDREPGESVVRATLAAPCPGAPGPETDYAVDLVFRFLPDLLRLAEQRAPQDTLTEILRGWARAFPLSSVGTAVEAGPPQAATLAHPALRRLYLDRIFTCRARERLVSPELRRWIEVDAGPHPEMAAKFAALLSAPTPAPTSTPAHLASPSTPP